MALLLRVARRPLIARSLAHTTATLYRPTRCAFLPPAFSAFSTTSEESLSFKDRLALLPATIKAFHARHGHFIMGFGFTVPVEDDSDAHAELPLYPATARGLSLGTTLYWLLVNATSRQKYSHVLQALGDIGFPVDVDWKQYVWEHQRIPALRVYQELYGDLRVPSSFVVPTGDSRWPIETWGFKLGYYAANIRRSYHRGLPPQHLKDLDGMNASWNLKELTHAQRLALLAPTLQVYHAKYGHFIMPFQFVVPKDEDSDTKQADQGGAARDGAWPLEARGERLGSTLYSFMKSESQRDENPHVVEDLADIGFPVDVEWEHYVFEHVPLAALYAYRDLHGDCQVPRTFVVPTGDTRWPIETWGLNLGNFASNIRSSVHRSLTQEQLDALAAVGLPLNLNELPFAERLPLLAPTVRAFHARHGHFILHANFTVPKEDDLDVNPHLPPYPAEARGAKLGTTLHRLLVSKQTRQKHSDVLQQLAEIGFPVDVDWKDYVFEHQRLPALRVYVELFGDCVVPQWFIVPTGDTKWPKETWGLKLGEYVMNIRGRDSRSLTQEQLERLDELGFRWGRHGKRRPAEAMPVVEALQKPTRK